MHIAECQDSLSEIGRINQEKTNIEENRPRGRRTYVAARGCSKSKRSQTKNWWKKDEKIFYIYTITYNGAWNCDLYRVCRKARSIDNTYYSCMFLRYFENLYIDFCRSRECLIYRWEMAEYCCYSRHDVLAIRIRMTINSRFKRTTTLEQKVESLARIGIEN